MDLSAFAADIDELIEAFVQNGVQELSHMKDVWRSRSFSFIHEARPPQVNPGFFMQSLYSYALDFLGHASTWLRKVGGLYVLYILYETQLSVPPYRIYLSLGCDTVYAVGAKGTVGRSGQPSKKYGARGVLGAVSVDLENIYSIVKEAKALGSHTALRVVNRMITKNFFLYGSISLSWKEMRETFEAAANKAVERVNKARKRILESSCAKEHFQGNLGNELGLDGLVLLNKEYARAKQCVYRDASSSRGENANSTDSVLGEELINDVKVWLKKRKSILNGETKGENTMLEKPPAVRDKEGENGAVYDESEYQDNGSVLDLNVSVENDNSFEAELEDALNWD